MNEESPVPQPPVKKPRKPTPPKAVRGKIGLPEFRDLLERCVAHRDLFTDAQIRFAQATLQSIHQDATGLIRVTISPLSSTPRPSKRKFSSLEVHSQGAPGDDEVRVTTREIAMLEDEGMTFSRIDGLPIEFLARAGSLFGFKSDSLAGLKSAFAHVVSDIRQMENIAAARPRDPRSAIDFSSTKGDTQA